MDLRNPEFTLQHPQDELEAHSYDGWESLVHTRDRVPYVPGLLDASSEQKRLFNLFQSA